jgi:hypothetical protein
MLMFTPLNLVPCDAAGVGATEAGTEAATLAGTDGAALLAAGEAVGVDAPQPAITTTSTIVAAVDLNRDTASSSS